MDNDFKQMVIKGLSYAIDALDKRTPQTKKQTEYIDIKDVNPLDIVSFMRRNNIPDTAYFGGENNGYDGLENVCLCWEIDIPTTNKDKLEFNKRVFDQIAFKFIYNLCIEKGYKRVGVPSNLFKEFQDTTNYEMYLKQDFDRLVKYYSLYFVKV